jgi:hypothetical protein
LPPRYNISRNASEEQDCFWPVVSCADENGGP